MDNHYSRLKNNKTIIYDNRIYIGNVSPIFVSDSGFMDTNSGLRWLKLDILKLTH